MVVKGIIEVPYIDGTPARVNHKTGYIFISKAHFDKMDPVYRDFVIAHEEGHLSLNTSNEEAADQYAVYRMIKKGYPLSKIMQSLTRVLNYDKPAHYGRTLNVFSLLAYHDIVKNNNKKLLNFLKQSNMVTPIENSYLDEIYMSSFVGDYDDFLGLGKKAQQRREERHKARMEKKAAKTEIKRAKALQKQAKAQAIAEGTYQPESFGSGVAKALGGLGQGVAAILGKGGGAEEPIEKSSSAQQPEKKNYTWIFIIVGVVVLLIIGYFLFFGKKKK